MYFKKKLIPTSWIIVYFCMIMLPIGSENFWFTKIFKIKNNFMVFDLLIMIIFFAMILNKIYRLKDIKLGKFTFVSGIYILFFIIAFFIGYSQYTQSAFNDGILYLRCFLIFYISKNIPKSSLSLDELLKITAYALTFSSLIILIVYFVSFAGTSTRVGSGNLSLYIMVLSYLLYKFSSEKNIKYKRLLMISFALFVITALISQIRTNIILTVLGLIITSIYLLFTRVKRGTIVVNIRKFYILFSIILLVFLSLLFLYFTNTGLSNRFFENDGNTGLARIYTFKYYWDQFINNPFGYGFGYIMHFVTENNYVLLQSGTYQIDNSIIVYAIKGGIGFLILNLYLLWRPIRRIKDKASKYISIMRWLYFLMLISATMITSQSIHSIAVSAFVWSIVGISYRNNQNIVS